MIRGLLKNPYFLIGFLFLSIVFLSSIFFSVFVKEHLPKPNIYLYNENHTPVEKAPFPPSLKHPFGTDDQGTDMLVIILDGAKFTIGCAIIVSLLRLLVSYLLGIVHGLYTNKLNKYYSQFINAFKFVPGTVIVLIFISPFLNQEGQYSVVYLTIIQIIILTLVAVPTLSELIGNEISLILKNEFIENSKILGGGKWHILKKHIIPFLKPKIFLLFFQQMIQTLIIIIHLGVFNMFIGGVSYLQQDLASSSQKAFSLSNEWAGLIGGSYQKLMTDPWIIYTPVFAFFLTILSLNFIVKGIEKTIKMREISFKKMNDPRMKQDNVSF